MTKSCTSKVKSYFLNRTSFSLTLENTHIKRKDEIEHATILVWSRKRAPPPGSDAEWRSAMGVALWGPSLGGDFRLRRSRKLGTTRDLNIRIHCHRHVTSNQPAIVPDMLYSLLRICRPSRTRSRINRSFESFRILSIGARVCFLLFDGGHLQGERVSAWKWHIADLKFSFF